MPTNKTEQTTEATPGHVASTDLLGGPLPERDDWQHLKRYGYAPGNYMSRCRRCRQIAYDVDKYARCCRPCAEAMHDAA